MIDSSTKKVVKTYVPLGVAGTAAYVAFDKKASWQVILIVAAIAGVFSYILTHSTINIIEANKVKPKTKTIDQNITGFIPPSFSPGHWVERIKKDVYAPWYFIQFRDTNLYRELSAMNDSQLLAISNAWLQKYYSEYNEQVYEAIDAELIGAPLSFIVSDLVDRWSKL